MRSPNRIAASVAVALLVSTVPALPSSAAHVISYWGLTSQDRLALVEVVKRDNGLRFLRKVTLFFIVTCEDSSTHEFSTTLESTKRLGEGGEFTLQRPARPGRPNSIPFHLEGTVRFGSAEGTFELRYTSFRKDGEAQLCTTGGVEWSLTRSHGSDREPSAPEDVSGLQL